MESQTIHHALAEVKKAVGAVGKTQRNQVQNFNFRGVDAVVNAAAPHLNEHGVITVPQLMDITYGNVEIGAKRTPMAHVIVKVKYVFIGPKGDYVEALVPAESMDSGDKAVAKAMSVAYRIALLQVLNLPTTDPDPDESVYERSGGRPENATSARRASSSKTAENADTGELRSAVSFATDAKNASTVTELREVWKAAGAAGVLKQSFADETSGEKLVLEDYLTTRGNELAHSKSGAATPAGSRRGGDK